MSASVRIIVWAALWMAAFCASVAQAAEEDQQAIESAREALDRWDSFPWYDDQTDQVRRIDVNSPPPPPQPDSWKTRKTKRQKSSWFTALMQVLKVAAWVLLAVLLVLLCVLLVRAYLRRESDAGGPAGSAEAVEAASDADRVESLPFKVRRPRSDLLVEARRCYREGNYAEAIIYLFSYQLVQLDRYQIIRLTKGKTNRQYLREIRRRSALRDLLRQTMVAFEDVFFGDRRLPQTRFEACWDRLDEFHQLAQQELA